MLFAYAAIGPVAAKILFDAASVDSFDNKHFSISWSAHGVNHIWIYAGVDPNHIDQTRLVAEVAGRGSVSVSDLPPAARWYFELVPDHGDPLVIADRSPHLQTAGNLRDIGGYRTDDGKWVRMGIAYRSNEISHLTPAEIEALTTVGLKLDIDLRTIAERERGPDRLPAGVAEISANVLVDDAAQIQEFVATPPGAPKPDIVKMNQAFYRDFVSSPGAEAAYHTLFEKAANPASQPMLFHCSAG